MTTNQMPQPLDAGGGPPDRPRSQLLVVALGVVVALVVASGVALVVLRAGDDEAAPVATVTTTTTASTTTVAAPTTVPATVPGTAPPTTGPPADTATAVWPYAASSTRYRDPRAAARGFAVDYVGVPDPRAGPFLAGDGRSGEVEVGGMRVLVRQLGPDGSWWVLGSVADRIRLDSPSALDVISSPVRLRGRSSAFEANVSVEIRGDGNRAPLGTGHVMGGAGATLEPFDGNVTFADPTPVAAGAVVLFERSAADGRVHAATVVRVYFATGGGTEPGPACAAGGRPTPPPGQMVVTVYFTCDGATLVPAYRVVPTSRGVLRASLEALLAGPSSAERTAGVESWFSADTAGMLAGVSLSNGRAVVDFRDLRPVIPNASTSAGSQLLLSQLNRTVFQFSTVRSVEYRIDGSCARFFEWLQMACQVGTR